MHYLSGNLSGSKKFNSSPSLNVKWYMKYFPAQHFSTTKVQIILLEIWLMQNYVRSKDWQLKYLIAKFTISDLKKQEFADIEMVAGASLVASGVSSSLVWKLTKLGALFVQSVEISEIQWSAGRSSQAGLKGVRIYKKISFGLDILILERNKRNMISSINIS